MCKSFKYFFICSSHVLIGLPRLLLPFTMMLLIRLTRASKFFLYTCQNHLNLFTRIFAEIGEIPCFSLYSWFLIIFIIVCPHIHLNIYISVTFIFCYSSNTKFGAFYILVYRIFRYYITIFSIISPICKYPTTIT